MTDRMFSDCCYGTEAQHLPSEMCPQAAQGVVGRLRDVAGVLSANLLFKSAASVGRAIDHFEELAEASASLLRELEWVNEQLDLMPDGYAEAQTRLLAALTQEGRGA